MADLDRRNQKTAFMQIDLSDPVKVTVQQRNILTPSETVPAKRFVGTLGASVSPASGTTGSFTPGASSQEQTGSTARTAKTQ
jgi:hypothetical protein